MAKRLKIGEQREQFLIGCNVIQKARKSFCTGFSVLGIDPARGATGWAYKNFEKSYHKVGVIIPPGYGFSKVMVIEKKLERLLSKKAKPFVAIEDYAFNSKFGREKAGELGGVIRRVLYRSETPMVTISPTTLKAWIKVRGKNQVMLEILDRYGIKIDQEDSADAFVLADIIEKALYVANHVSEIKLSSPKDVQDYIKNKTYLKVEALKNLYAYQMDTLFKLISSKGKNVIFFNTFFMEE